ncbi:M56 family metallopeptidase [Lysobacter sp. CA199]|uniref:M56 family metallopeptidase n=1 Tax=Lysobacter sp. CA199 TaxID=3455608 RepID=UPI003F8D3F36
MESAIENLIEAAPALAAQHLLQSAALFALALTFMRMRALSAELRSWLLLAVLALAVLCPLAAFLPGTSSSPSWTYAAHIVPQPEEGPTADEAVFDAGRRPDMMYLEIPRSFTGVLALAWALGALWQLMRLVEGARQARRLRRCARPALALETALAGELPLYARIATTAVDGPMVVGLLRPTILIPHALAYRLEPEALRDILRHEIAHIRRGDLWLTTVVRILLAAFWWSPFLRLIHARLDLAREMACDARAARAGDTRVDYAGSLLSSAETLLDLGERPAWLAVAMLERRSHLAQRIDGLIEQNPLAEPRRERTAIVLCVSAMLAFAGLSVASTPRLGLAGPQVAEPDARVVELLAAAREGDAATVRKLAGRGVDVNARVLGDGTALIQAVHSRDLSTVEALLALGADPNRASLGEGNPLIAASELGAQPIVERLVQAGADVNRVVTYDETPLINAAREGHLATVEYLVAHGADVNLGVVADGWLGRWRSPLNQTRNPGVRAYLISQGAVAGHP